MRFDKFTIKSQELIQNAQSLASRHGNQQIEPEHLVLSMLAEKEGLASSLLRKLGVSAEAIVRATGVPLHTHPGLKERPFGIWDGLYFDDIARDYPEEFKAWKRDPVHFVPDGGETIHDHMVRVTAAVTEIVERHPGEMVVIVAHVGPIRMCVTDALQMPLEAYRRLTIDYGSLTRVDYGKRQHNLIYLNRRSRE